MSKPPTKIRWSELRLAAICALTFGIATGLLLPGVWPLMPFPALAPVEITALLGLLFGFLTRRGWTLLLPLTVLVSIDPPGAGIAGAFIALLVLWPFSAAGSVVGIAGGKALQRQMLRRTLKAAGRRERASRPRATARAQTAAGR